MFVDSHAHLDSPQFGADLESVLERATAAGVATILHVGCVQDSPRAIEDSLRLLEKHEWLVAALGVHPHDARHFSEAVGRDILAAAAHPRIVGWGEIGLDFHYDNSPRDQQRDAFRRQLELAQEAGKPVIIHTREALDETIRILEEAVSKGALRGVFHCFGGNLKAARRCVDLGFLVGLGGILTFPRAEELREVARVLPDECFLIETDCPYLAPVPYRGRRNEPAYVALVAEKLAEVRNTPLEAIGSVTTANFRRLFQPLDTQHR